MAKESIVEEKPLRLGQIRFTKPSKTKSEFVNECDINRIVANAKRYGALPPSMRQAQFADVSNLGDYTECMTMVQEAKAQFMTLPASTRTRFDNDPGKLLAFLNNPKNRDEAVKLGLVVPSTPKAPEPAAPAPTPAQGV